MKSLGPVLMLVLVGGCQPKLATGADLQRSTMTVKPLEQTVQFKGAGGIDLEGTLTLPPGKQDAVYPGVLLLPGSGPTDRDGNQPGLKTDILKQIAIGLAKAGIASFRFDKRAAAANASQWPKDPAKYGPFFSWDNHIGDAMGAWKAMKGSGRVDGAHCAVLGHSEGGVIALAMAKQAKPVALVLVGTPGRTFDAVIRSQLSAKLLLAGEAGKKLLEASDRITEHVKRTGEVPGDVPSELKPLYNASVGLYYKQVMAVQPVELMRGFGGATLVMNGEADDQVDPKLDAQPLYEIAKGGWKGSQLALVPLASHFLKPVKKPGDDPFGGDIVPDALATIERFLVQAIGGTMPEDEDD